MTIKSTGKGEKVLDSPSDLPRSHHLPPKKYLGGKITGLAAVLAVVAVGKMHGPVSTNNGNVDQDSSKLAPQNHQLSFQERYNVEPPQMRIGFEGGPRSIIIDADSLLYTYVKVDPDEPSRKNDVRALEDIVQDFVLEARELGLKVDSQELGKVITTVNSCEMQTSFPVGRKLMIPDFEILAGELKDSKLGLPVEVNDQPAIRRPVDKVAINRPDQVAQVDMAAIPRLKPAPVPSNQLAVEEIAAIEKEQDFPVTSYRVKKGDTVSGIAEKLGNMSLVKTIAELNGLNSEYKISRGQELIVPDLKVIDQEELITANLAVTKDLLENEKEVAYQKYKIVDGNTLYGLSRKFSVTVGELLRANGLESKDIYAGEILLIPESRQVRGGVRVSTKSAVSPDAPLAERLQRLKDHNIEVSNNPSCKESSHFVWDCLIAAGYEGKELAQFMAQLSHECDHFKTMEEYASGKGYEGRADLGNTQPGDGVRFKGRGYIQITGRDNYNQFGRRLGYDLVNNPELAEDPQVAIQLAIAYWEMRVKDSCQDFSDTKVATKCVNGGSRGLGSRKRAYARYLKIIFPRSSRIKTTQNTTSLNRKGVGAPEDVALVS